MIDFLALSDDEFTQLVLKDLAGNLDAANALALGEQLDVVERWHHTLKEEDHRHAIEIATDRAEFEAALMKLDAQAERVARLEYWELHRQQIGQQRELWRRLKVVRKIRTRLRREARCGEEWDLRAAIKQHRADTLGFGSASAADLALWSNVE